MTEAIVTGIIQGIFEWLPVSSKSFIILAKINLFGREPDLEILIKEALLLHLGTFLAALIYLRKDIFRLAGAALNYKKTGARDRGVIKFIVIASLLSGVLGFVLLKVAAGLLVTGKILNLVIGFFLLLTAWIQFRSKKQQADLKSVHEAGSRDGLVLGVAQGLAGIPGISRSGITVGALLMRKFDDVAALRLSFILSLPIVLGGNIFLNFRHFLSLTGQDLIGILFSFVFGILTIDALLKIARKVNFAYFVLVFGLTMIGFAILV